MLDDVLRGIRGHYFSMPEWAKTIVGGVYGLLPFRVRMGSTFTEFVQLLEKSRHWSLEQIRAYQYRELKRTIELAYGHIPFYRRHFARAGVTPADLTCLEDIAHFPFLTKTDIQEHLGEMTANYIPAWRRLMTTTGGSTTEPMRFWHLKGVTRSKEKAFIWNQWAQFGYRPRARTILLKGRETGDPHRGIFWEREPIDNFLAMNSSYLTEAHLPAYLDAMEWFRPEFMIGYVSSIHLLARYLKRHPERSMPKFRAIFLTSETVYHRQRAELEDVFRCPISSHYGHSEMVLLGTECPQDRQLHFYPQYGLLELLDENGRPASEPGAKGELVGTSFHNPVMPFVRYRTQDYGTLGESRCACHSYFPTLKDIEGRLQEFIVASDRRLIPVSVMCSANFDTLDRVYQSQYYQDTPGKLVFKVVPRPGFCEKDRQGIRRAITDKVGMEVDIRLVASIPRTKNGKHLMIEQRIPLNVLRSLQDPDSRR